MATDKLAIIIPELGYALKRMPECYILMKWDAGGVNTRGRNVGESREAGWVSMDKYPVTLNHGLQMIRERAIADGLSDASAKEALVLIERIISIVNEANAA